MQHTYFQGNIISGQTGSKMNRICDYNSKSYCTFFLSLIYVFGCAGSSLLLRLLSSCVRCKGFSLQRLLLLRGTGCRVCGVPQLRLPEHRLRSHGAGAQLLQGIWDPPESGIETVSLHWQADSLPLSYKGSPHEVDLGQGLRIFISNKFQGDGDIAGPGTTL